MQVQLLKNIICHKFLNDNIKVQVCQNGIIYAVKTQGYMVSADDYDAEVMDTNEGRINSLDKFSSQKEQRE